MKLSVIIPARNEAACIGETVRKLRVVLAGVDHEIVVVDDGSWDETLRVASCAGAVVAQLPKQGIGSAIRTGLLWGKGDVFAIFMADGSDDPRDLLFCYHILKDNADIDMVFGDRWSQPGMVHDYPWPKLILNRIANRLLALALGIPYADLTNAFKLYRRHVIETIRPIEADDFSVLIEIPLKALKHHFSFAVCPISWTNRKQGKSKFRIAEMGSKYLRTIWKVMSYGSFLAPAPRRG